MATETKKHKQLDDCPGIEQEPWESKYHWLCRRKFIEDNRSSYELKKVVSLSMVWFNVKFMGCHYSPSTEDHVSFYPIPDHDEIDRWLKAHQDIEGERQQVPKVVKMAGKRAEPEVAIETTPTKLPKLEPLPPEDKPTSSKETSMDYSDLTQHLDALISTLRKRSDTVKPPANTNTNNNGNKERGGPAAARLGLVARLSRNCICDACYPSLPPVSQLQVLCSRERITECYEFSPNSDEIQLYIGDHCMLRQACSAYKGAKTSIAQEMVREVLEYQTSHTQPTCPASKNRALSLSEVKQGGGMPSHDKKKLTGSNKGHQMMLKMGWSGEGGLGSGGGGREDPVEMDTRGKSRSGFGSTQKLALHRKDVRSVLMTFIESEDTQLEFPSSLAPEERKLVHSLSEQYHLYHKSKNLGEERFLVVRKKVGSATLAGSEVVAMETQKEGQGPFKTTRDNKYNQDF